MKKYFLKFLFLSVMVIGLSITAFGQKSGDKKPRKPKNTPKIIVPKNNKKPPKKDRRKKKNHALFSKIVRTDINSSLS